MLTHIRVAEVLLYEPDSGEFLWRANGKRAGYLQRGYFVIEIDGTPYRANRLAWFYMTGAWPVGFVDHSNGVTNDDRWSNLRIATRAQNRANSKSSNKYGLKGIRPHRRKWKAEIRVNGKRIGLGIFATPQEAHAAYMSAAKKHFGEFARGQ